MNYETLRKELEKYLPQKLSQKDLLKGLKEKTLEENYTPQQIETAIETHLFNDLEGETLLTWAAKENCLKNIPKKFLTAKNVSLPNKDGNTCLHMAAHYKTLDEIPQEAITTKTLLTKNNNGKNCFHIATAEGNLKQLPKNTLTEKNLLEQNKDGSNCFHLDGERAGFLQIPKKLLTTKNLTKPNNHGKTPIHLAVSQFMFPEGTLSPKTLLELKETFKKDKSAIKKIIHQWIDQELQKAAVKLYSQPQ